MADRRRGTADQRRRTKTGTKPVPRGHRGFATTWWGLAWLEALEERAQLDPNRLPRGRAYARRGNVDRLVVNAGEVSANVAGSRETPYKVRVRVRRLSDAEWDAVCSAIAAKAGHAAALLDGELHPGVVADASDAGVELLPGAGEVQPRCSCPDWADPCKHAAAVCYLVAPELDHDPFALLALRGRSRDEVIDAVRRRRAGVGRDRETNEGGDGAPDPDVGSSAIAPSPDPGVEARSVWHGDATRPPLPKSAALPAAPRAPLPLRDSQIAGAPDAGALASLAADAAARAWALLAGEAGAGLDLDAEADLARRAAAALSQGTETFDDLAARAGMRGRDLLVLAAAWRDGGRHGVELVTGRARWQPPARVLSEAAAMLQREAGPELRLRVEPTRLVLVGRRAALHPGPDGRWYRLERRRGRLTLPQPPADDPADLVDQLDR